VSDAHAKAVEAAARAICEDQERSGGPPWDMWPEMERSGRIAKETFRNQARDAIDTYLAAMRAEGWVMVRDCGEKPVGDPAIRAWSDDRDECAAIDKALGWNEARRAMLGGNDDER
jgi:hypothetical protein